MSKDLVRISVMIRTEQLNQLHQTDLDLEPYVVNALKVMIKDKIGEMQKLHDSL